MDEGRYSWKPRHSGYIAGPSPCSAAYNAGSGAVDACSCVPSYPETIAYVARILACSTAPER